MHTLTSAFFPKSINTTIISTHELAQEACAKLYLVSAVASQALEHFRNGNYKAFDALVGETSCQLRADRVQQLARAGSLTGDNIEEKLARIGGNLRRLFVENNHDVESLQSHVEFCRALLNRCYKDSSEEHAQSFKLSPDAAFLILSHTLCLTRDHVKRQMTNAQQLEGVLPEEMRGIIKKECYEQMVLSVKRSLARASVEHVKRMAGGDFYTALFKTSVIGSCDLQCAPCFPSIDLILQKIQADGRPLALVIQKADQRVVIPFAVKGKKHVLVEAQEVAQEPVIVFEGVSTHPATQDMFVQELLGTEDPFGRACEMIRMNAAAHPQYAGPKKLCPIPLLEGGEEFAEQIRGKVDPFVGSEEEFNRAMRIANCDSHAMTVAQKKCTPASLAEVVRQRLRLEALAQLARENGCTQKETGGFSLRHIYCSRLEDVLREKQVVESEVET